MQDNAVNESVAIAEAAGILEREAGIHSAVLLTDHARHFWKHYAGAPVRAIVLAAGMGALDWATRAVTRLRQVYPATPIVMAGCHVSFFPETGQAAGADFVLRGEADETLLAWAHQDFHTDSLPAGLLPAEQATQAPYAPITRNVDRLSPPKREIYWSIYPFSGRVPLKRFVSSRGCIYSCTFCYNPPLMQQAGGPAVYHRRKSVGHMLQEIQQAQDFGPLRQVHFSDDLFSANPEWLREFLPAYERTLAIPFSCNIIGSQVTPALADAMAAAGCRMVSIGVETHNEQQRRKALSKPVGNQKLLEIAQRFRKHGVRVTTFNLLGLPGQTPEDALKTIDFSRQMQASHLRANLAWPLPETGLHQQWGRTMQPSAPGLEGPDGLLDPVRAVFYLQYWLFRFPALRKAALSPRLRRYPAGYKLAYGLSHVVSGYGFPIPPLDALRYLFHIRSPHKFNNFWPSIL